MTDVKEIFNGVYQFKLKQHIDDRGFFSEIYKNEDLLTNNISYSFVQDNLSFSEHVNTIRGLHYQNEPFDQSKYVIVLKGKIWDVFVDLRKSSNTYLKFGFTELTQNQSSLLIPKGFAHGFCTLEPNTLVLYKVDNPYSKEHEEGIVWNDETLNIPWPVDKNKIILSEKDEKLPNLGKIE